MMTGICNEEWRAISGYANYQISSIGRIRILRTAKIVKPLTDSRGYLCMELMLQGKHSVYWIQNLVANKFLERPFNKPFIHHIDRNPRNNATNNLRFRAYPVNRARRLKEDSDEEHCEEDDCEEDEFEEDDCDEDDCEEEEGA